MVKSSPRMTLAQGSDRRFINELKKEPITSASLSTPRKVGLPRIGRRSVRSLIFLIAVVLIASPVLTPRGWARSPGGYPGTVEAKVRYVYRAQQLVVLDDGTLLRATRPGQLEPLHEGDMVRVLFVSTAGQKLIERIETLPR